MDGSNHRRFNALRGIGVILQREDVIAIRRLDG